MKNIGIQTRRGVHPSSASYEQRRLHCIASEKEYGLVTTEFLTIATSIEDEENARSDGGIKGHAYVPTRSKSLPYWSRDT